MQCFSHQTTAAIGACKECGRGVCAQCAQDLGFVVVCSATCAAHANEVRELERRATKMYGIGSARRRIPTAALTYGLIGAGSIGLGVAPVADSQPVDLIYILGGVVLCGIGLMIYRRYSAIGLQV